MVLGQTLQLRDLADRHILLLQPQKKVLDSALSHLQLPLHASHLIYMLCLAVIIFQVNLLVLPMDILLEIPLHGLIDSHGLLGYMKFSKPCFHILVPCQ